LAPLVPALLVESTPPPLLVESTPPQPPPPAGAAMVALTAARGIKLIRGPAGMSSHMPKSPRQASPLARMKMFDGLMSRWSSWISL
jgi:hypothetical protein